MAEPGASTNAHQAGLLSRPPAASAAPDGSGSGVLTAQFKSRKRRSGPRGKTPWKTHFWVANVQDRTIMLFKSDLAINPKKIIHATDITNVGVSSDKHNKFFHLNIRLRGADEREVKVQSREVRDRWMSAVLAMMRSVRNDDKIRSVLSVVQQLTSEWSAEFGVTVQTNLEVLAGLSTEYHPMYVKGLMAGAALVRRVLPLLPNRATSEVITEVRLAVTLATATSNQGAAHTRDTRYDPAGKLLHIGIQGSSPMSSSGQQGHGSGATLDPDAFTFATVDGSAVVGMIGSTVWRNPELDEFLREGSAGRSEADRIAKLIGVERFNVNLQWAHDLDQHHDATRIKAYIDRFVNVKLLGDIHRVLQQVIQADTNTSIALLAKHTTGTSSDPYNGNDGFGDSQDPPLLSATECLARYVSGVGVLINSESVSANRMPPVTLRHDMWKDGYLGPAFTLTSRHRNASGASGSRGADASEREEPLKNLGQQLHDVILHVRVAEACRRLEAVCGSELDLKEGVTAAWESLISTVVATSPSLTEQRISLLLWDFTTLYRRRLAGLWRALSAAGFAERLRSALRGWRVTFVTPGGSSSSTGAGAAASPSVPSVTASPALRPQQVPTGGSNRLPLPIVENNVFVDTVLLLGGHQVQPDGITTLHAIDHVAGLRAAFAVDDLRVWFLGFCSVPANLHPYPHEDEQENEEDRSDDDEGEAKGVGGLRQLEARVLTDTQVASQVYDSQSDGSPGWMKVGATAIEAAIEAIEEAFPDAMISKHDLARVLALTLAKLRQLVHRHRADAPAAASSRGGGDPTDRSSPVNSSELSRAQALDVLTAYCEYSETAGQVEAALDQAVLACERPAAGDTAAGASQDSPPRSDAVSFGVVGWAVLCYLMPAEAVLAMRSRRDVLVVGLENTGKTLIINSLKGVQHPTDPSVGVLTTIVPFKECVFSMKELGGRAEVRKNFKHHIGIVGHVHAVIFCLDAAQGRSVVDAHDFLHEVLGHKLLAGCPCLLVANNSKAEGTLTPEDVDRELGVAEICAKSSPPSVWKTVPCEVTMAQHNSANDAGLVAGLDWLAAQLMS